MKRASKAALAFVASQLLLWTGCNAILGNGYGAFDESAVGPGGPGGEGGIDDDALGGGEGGGPGSEGGPGTDGGPGSDGNVTDANNGDGGTCPRSICPTKLVAATAPQRIAVGATAVYWTTADKIGRVNLDGTAAVPPVAVVGGDIVSTLTRGIALQAGVPYVTVADRGAGKCTADLSTCTNIQFIGTGIGAVSSSVAVDATKVYVGLFDSASGNGGLWQIGLDGSGAMPYTQPLERVYGLRVANGIAYYQTGSDIKSVSSLTGAPSYAVVSGDTPVAFDVVPPNLVVATGNKGLRVCTTSFMTNCTAPITYVATAAINAVLIDGTDVIWAQGAANGAIYRAPLAGGSATELLAEGQASPSDLAADGTSIYWANHGDSVGAGGAIMKLPK